METFRKFVIETMGLDPKAALPDHSAIEMICTASINRDALLSAIKKRYDVTITRTDLVKCGTLIALKRQIDVKIERKNQAYQQGRCNISLQRERILGSF